MFANIWAILPDTNVTKHQITYTTQEGTTLWTLVYRPAAATQKLPIFVFYHGGGMCVRTPEMNAAFCQTVTLEHNVVGFAAQHRLAPELPSSIGWSNSCDVLLHMQSPLFRASTWPTGLHHLPRTFFPASGLDALRDDSYVCRDMLARQGVETRLENYPGALHFSWVLGTHTELGRKWTKDATKAFWWLFRREVKGE